MPKTGLVHDSQQQNYHVKSEALVG